MDWGILKNNMELIRVLLLGVLILLILAAVIKELHPIKIPVA